MISDGSVSLGQNTDAAKPKATVATVGREPFYDWDLTQVRHGMVEKSSNPFRIRSGNSWVYTTFAIELETLR